MSATETYLVPSEIADRLRVDKSTVQRLISRGELPAVRVGKNLRVLPTDLAKYLEANSTARPTVRRRRT